MYQHVSVKLLALSKKIGSRVLFEGVTATVNPGQCLAITGPNGSGKSTLLKMIAGLSRVTTGRIQVLGDGKELDVEERIAYLGVVSPEIVFYADMTGKENLVFFVGVYGRKCSVERIVDCCQIVGLSEAKDQFVETYSTGMRQRLKFALMLAIKPLLWLLDEPSSNLDAEGKRLVNDMISNALAEQRTVIIATNESWEAQHAVCNIELT